MVGAVETFGVDVEVGVVCGYLWRRDLECGIEGGS
jgi:hypothetical protein